MNSITPKVGDILKGSYGYEASIPVFAKVIAVKAKTIQVVELEGRSFNYTTGGMEWKVEVTDVARGEVMTKQIKATDNGYRIKWNEYCSLWGPWTPVVVGAYNYH